MTDKDVCPVCANEENVLKPVRERLREHGFTLTTPAMEPEEAVMEAAGDVVTGEPAIDTALLLLDLYNAITGEDGMTGDIDGIQEVMDHPLMTTSFRDYTVTEGLLLLLLLSAFIAACARILKGGFSWLR